MKSMGKILTIARREYAALVATRAFLVGLCVTPLLLLGGLLGPGLTNARTQELCRVAVVDHTGKLTQSLRDELRHPRAVQDLANGLSQLHQLSGRDAGREEPIPEFELEEIPAATFSDLQRLQLSDRIRSGELYGFLEIPADLLTAGADTDTIHPLWVSEVTVLAKNRRYLSAALTEVVRIVRLSAHLDAEELRFVQQYSDMHDSFEIRSPYYRDAEGQIVAGSRKSTFSSVVVPLVLLMMMFLVIMMSAQPMLESVLEEKTLRISEVLLGSASARQLMIGKLLGNVAGSLTIFAVYVVGCLMLGAMAGVPAILSPAVLPWYLLFQLLAVLLFSALFMSIAAAVSQMREAQCLLMPVWGVIMLPMFLILSILEDPNSTLATAISFFPPSAPMVMTMRLTSGTPIPPIQIAGSLVMLLLGTACSIIAAARIYRGGLLLQGRAARGTDVLNWLWNTDDTQ